MHTTTTVAIHANDFSPNPGAIDRDMWTAGKMRHVVAALAGAPVAITIDDQAGHTLLGARLLEVVFVDFSDQPVLRIGYQSPSDPEGGATGTQDAPAGAPAEGWTHDHPIHRIGPVIIPLTPEGGKARYAALGTHHDEVRAAIAHARAQHGDREGRSYGTWTAASGSRHVTVTYRPNTGDARFADRAGTVWCGRVTLDEVADQLRCEAEEKARRQAEAARAWE